VLRSIFGMFKNIIFGMFKKIASKPWKFVENTFKFENEPLSTASETKNDVMTSSSKINK
jgi:hypothetical protein